MRAIIGVLFLIRLLGTKGDLMIQDIGNASRYNPSTFDGLSGSCYEKPVGWCQYGRLTGIYGCQCSAPAVVGVLTNEYGHIEFVVCTMLCEENLCPTVPVGTVSRQSGSCLIKCVDDKDCPPKGVCTMSLSTQGVCMYRQ